MDRQQESLVEAIRAILGPNDAGVSTDRILALLKEANNDPNKAVDLFFQVEAANGHAGQNGVKDSGGAAKQDVKRIHSKDQWTDSAKELNDLLGGQVPLGTIHDLLKRSKNNLQKSVEIYFAENGGDDAFASSRNGEDDGTAVDHTPNGTTSVHLQGPRHNPVAATATQELPADSTEQPISPSHLTPLTPLSPSAARTPPSTPENSPVVTPHEHSNEPEALTGPDTYEVIMVEENFKWQIGNVFGRAVVQSVDPQGAAATHGILKSDVLLMFRDTVITPHNCATIVEQLCLPSVPVPSTLRFRRAPEHQQPAPGSPPMVPMEEASAAMEKVTEVTLKEAEGKAPEISNGLPPSPSLSPQTGGGTPFERPLEQTKQVMETDEDVDMEAHERRSSKVVGKIDPKYGLQLLIHHVDSMLDALGDSSVEIKPVVDLLVKHEFNLDNAVDEHLDDNRKLSDFRDIIGSDYDPSDGFRCMQSAPYTSSIPSGPLGLTVENVLERTIVVDIKPGGAAEKADVKKCSWLVGINHESITGLTHKETLRLIETAQRPLHLELVQIPSDTYKQLRRQLTASVRQPKTEQPIAEKDRMSFRVLQAKMQQALLVLPRAVTAALFQYLNESGYSVRRDLSDNDPLDRLLPPLAEWDAVLLKEAEDMEEEREGDMCAERQFLLNLFGTIHEYEDKGESTVIRTIKFFGWLAKRCAEMHAQVMKSPAEEQSLAFRSRYELLLSVVLQVLESLSIIENHATWDVMVSAYKLLLTSLNDNQVRLIFAPMVARLSVSASPTARIVPVALLPLLYPCMDSDVLVQLRGMLDRLCGDDNPLVRRAVTAIIADLAKAAGADIASWSVQLLDKATTDSHDIVRIFAVKACVQLAWHLDHIFSDEPSGEPLRLLYCQMVPMVNTYVSDSSWQVRLEASRTLPELLRVFGSEYTDVFVDHFVGMVRDQTVELRRTCAENVYAIGQALIALARAEENGSSDMDVEKSVERLSLEGGDDQLQQAQTKIVRSVLPATYSLAMDSSVAVRLALAQSLGKSLSLISGHSYEELVPIFTQFLDDAQDPTTRATLLEQMARHGDRSSDTITSLALPAIRSLKDSANWRVRLKYVHCVSAFAERESNKSDIAPDFATGLLSMLTDSVYEVRIECCQRLPLLVKALGQEWLSSQAAPAVSQLLRGTFHSKVTALRALEELSPQLEELGKLREAVEAVVDECTSRTPNLRFRALRSLALLAPKLGDAQMTQSALEIVKQLANDETESDIDVREQAIKTESILEQALQS